jgi:hypothetical protein
MHPVLAFKPGTRVDADEWALDGKKITEPTCLAAIHDVLKEDGPVLLEHRYLRGARAPDHIVFDDFEALTTYLSENARAGDNVYVWNLSAFIRDAQPLAYGKCPDADGAVPKKGPY